MRSLIRISLIAAGLAGLLLLSACGSSGEDVVSSDGTDGDTPVSSDVTGQSLPGATDTTVGQAWTRIESTEDLANPVIAEPLELVADPDDDQVVLVRFYGGVQECYGSRATVQQQDATSVVIRLESGAQPDAGDTACIEIAEAQELAVTLDAPLAGRTLTAAPAI